MPSAKRCQSGLLAGVSQLKEGVVVSAEETEHKTPRNQTAIAFTLTSASWFAVATTFGLIAAGYLMAPDFMANIEFIHFGRMRPMHINAVLFGFVTPGLLAAAFYYVPRLLRSELHSQKLGVLTAIFWNITLVAGMIGLSLGHTQGREYAELPWIVDIMVVIAFLLVFQCFHFNTYTSKNNY